MIKVTLDEAKVQEKPFPKLMSNDTGTWVGLFINSGECIWLTGPYAFSHTKGVSMHGVMDFDSEITIQNA